MQPKQLQFGVLYQDESTDKIQIYAVCDGIGGNDNGEVASYIVADSLSKLASQKRMFSEEYISTFLRDVNSQCLSLRVGTSQPGSTLAMIVFSGKTASVVHVGDSRVYFMRGGQLNLLTRDHSQAQDFVDSGALTSEEASVHPSASVLTRYFGTPHMLVPCIYTFSVSRADVFLLCSDGLSDMVPECEIAAILHNENCATACKELTARALSYGGYDNTTAMVLKLN